MQLINDLSVKLKQHESEIVASIRRVLDSGWLVLGPEVEQFENKFADYHSVKYCLGVANGTDAIELALRAIGVQSDSTVATVANAGAYTTTALKAIGATPYFMEVDEETQCVTLESIQSALKKGVDAVVVTHLFGRITPEIVEIAEYCEKLGVPVLEDCAQAHGSSLSNKLAGTFGTVASFSFYPTKNLGALGDGGAVITNNQKLAETIKQLRQYGWSEKYQIGTSGGRNSRLDAMQAAMLSLFLPHLNQWNDERLSIAIRYNDEINHAQVSKPPINLDLKNKPFTAHLYVVQTPFRESLQAHLKRKKIASDIHYPIPDHKQTSLVDTHTDVSLPVTERLSQRILTLPCYPGMPTDQVSHVINSVNSWEA